MRFDVMPVATEKQVEEIANIAAPSWHDDYKNIFSNDQIDYMLKTFNSKDAIRQNMADRCIYYMLLLDNRFAGYVAFKAHFDHIFIHRIYIRPEFRRKGLARRTITAFDTMVSGDEFKSIKKLKILVEKKNDSAIEAYERLGFRKIRRIETHLGENYYSDDYLMERGIRREQREGKSWEIS